MKKHSFDSLEETVHLIAQERNEAGCFIITKHHDGSYSFGTSGMNGDSVPLKTALLQPHSGHLAIDSSFIFENMERQGWEH